MQLLQPGVSMSEKSKDHPHARYACSIEPEHFEPNVILMRGRGYQEKRNGNEDNNYRLISPANKRIKVSMHTRTDIEEQEKPPRSNT
jgi:hypothetical protein